MPAGHGLRSRTRDKFSRAFRGKGFIPLSTYLRTYKVGDFVDIKVNSAVMKVCDPPPPPPELLFQSKEYLVVISFVGACAVRTKMTSRHGRWPQ